MSGKRITTHIHNLRPFIYDPIRTNPLTVAQHNEQEFIVESILGHHGDRNRRSTLTFRVRWSGFDDSSDSWEPYKALMHVDKLHDYLRANKMKTLIPKEHTENLFQDFPGLFPASAGFPLRFLVSETSHTSVVLTLCASLSSFIHPFTRTYMF